MTVVPTIVAATTAIAHDAVAAVTASIANTAYTVRLCASVYAIQYKYTYIYIYVYTLSIHLLIYDRLYRYIYIHIYIYKDENINIWTCSCGFLI